MSLDTTNPERLQRRDGIAVDWVHEHNDEYVYGYTDERLRNCVWYVARDGRTSSREPRDCDLIPIPEYEYAALFETETGSTYFGAWSAAIPLVSDPHDVVKIARREKGDNSTIEWIPREREG